MMLAPFFRRFELPWSLEEESERKFKKLLRILLIIATCWRCSSSCCRSARRSA